MKRIGIGLALIVAGVASMKAGNALASIVCLVAAILVLRWYVNE